MNKYQETLNKQIKYAEFTENTVVCLDIEVAKGLLNTQIEACEKAEKYDKKEKPKKPLIKKYANSEHYLCPNCQGRRFGIIDYGDYKNEWRKGSELMPYCPRCGQKLDWSEVDE